MTFCSTENLSGLNLIIASAAERFREVHSELSALWSSCSANPDIDATGGEQLAVLAVDSASDVISLDDFIQNLKCRVGELRLLVSSLQSAHSLSLQVTISASIASIQRADIVTEFEKIRNLLPDFWWRTCKYMNETFDYHDFRSVSDLTIARMDFSLSALECLELARYKNGNGKIPWRIDFSFPDYLKLLEIKVGLQNAVTAELAQAIDYICSQSSAEMSTVDGDLCSDDDAPSWFRVSEAADVCVLLVSDCLKKRSLESKLSNLCRSGQLEHKGEGTSRRIAANALLGFIIKLKKECSQKDEYTID